MTDMASEAANVVLRRGELGSTVVLVALGQRVLRIVRTGVGTGMCIAGTQMLLGSFGLIPPAANAIMQECVALGAIFNSLRVLRFDVEATLASIRIARAEVRQA